MKRIFTMVCASTILYSTAYTQNVGIGTSTPDVKLHIIDTVELTDGNSGAFIKIQNATQTNTNGVLSGIKFRVDGVNNANSRYKGAIAFEKTGAFGEGKLHFLTNNVAGNANASVSDSRMTIMPDGRIGINNTNPTRAKVEIAALNSETQFISGVAGGGPGISFSAPLGFTQMIGMNLYYQGGHRLMSNGYGMNIAYSPTSGVMSFVPTSTKMNANEISLFGNSTLILDSNGYVGIRTSSPKAPLHVNSNMVIGSVSTVPATGYILSVNGKIMSEEVRVQLDAEWPDYVFGKSYRLMPLTEIEKFINNHQHLPGIPSASQVQQEGLMLGDMQKKMMEKIEELTLHMIELDKQNRQLKQELDNLRKQVSQ